MRVPDRTDRDRVLELTAKILSAHVGANSVEAHELPSLITLVFRTLSGVETAGAEPEKAEPAVPIKRSVLSDHLACLECGKSFKTLKRHLRTYHSLPPDKYRLKWGLPISYPMVAPDYAATRSKLALNIGKRRGIAKAPAPAMQVTKIPEVKRGRRRMSA